MLAFTYCWYRPKPYICKTSLQGTIRQSNIADQRKSRSTTTSLHLCLRICVCTEVWQKMPRSQKPGGRRRTSSARRMGTLWYKLATSLGRWRKRWDPYFLIFIFLLQSITARTSYKQWWAPLTKKLASANANPLTKKISFAQSVSQCQSHIAPSPFCITSAWWWLPFRNRRGSRLAEV